MAEPEEASAEHGWQSDIIADLIRQFGFPYITLNPGASYRGLHDSLVNHNGDDPPMLLCQHEKIAVQIAHGYAKASGEPLCRDRAQRRRAAARDHGRLLRLYGSRAGLHHRRDRSDGRRQAPPARRLGAHRATCRARPVRDYVKWDYQPGGIEGVLDSFARAYSIMMTEPQGPIYMCYDACAAGSAADGTRSRFPIPRRAKVPSRHGARPDGARGSRRAHRRGRMAGADAAISSAAVAIGLGDMVALAEALGAPVADVGIAPEFPHRASARLPAEQGGVQAAPTSSSRSICRDWERPTHYNDRINRTLKPHYPAELRNGSTSASPISKSGKWAMGYQKFPECARSACWPTPRSPSRR